MSEKNNDLDRAESIMESQSNNPRTTSFAKEVELGSYKENSLDRTEPLKPEFEKAHDNVQPEPTPEPENQAPKGPRNEPGMHLRPDGPNRKAVDREIHQEQLSNLADEARALNDEPGRENGIENGNEIEWSNGRTDDNGHGR